MSGTICLSVFQAGSPSVSLSPRWGPLCPCDFPPHCDFYLGLSVQSVGPPLGMQAEQKEEKGVSTKLTAPVSPHPNTTGDQVKVMSLRSPSSGPAPSISVSFEFSLPHGSTRSCAWLQMESWAAEGRYAWASRARGSTGPSRDPQPWPLLCGHLWSLQRGFGGHGCYDQPALGLVRHVGRAQVQTPALKWQQPQAFLMPTSPTEAYIRSACQSSFTLQSVALERVIISTSGQDYNHKKKNGNSIHWNECSYCWTSDSQVTAQSSEGCEEFLWPWSCLFV